MPVSTSHEQIFCALDHTLKAITVFALSTLSFYEKALSNELTLGLLSFLFGYFPNYCLNAI